jgi:uncharacterized membrane protein
MEGPWLMDAVLAPNRSLSRQAFGLVIGSFALMNCGVAIVFLLHGAYPVSGFLGLDVFALAWAFRLNYRSGRARERVQVAHAAVCVTASAPDAPDAHWTVSPLWLQVHDEAGAVRMAAGGRSVIVGGFLSPPERSAFAAALRRALDRARRPQGQAGSPSTSWTE